MKKLIFVIFLLPLILFNCGEKDKTVKSDKDSLVSLNIGLEDVIKLKKYRADVSGSFNFDTIRFDFFTEPPIDSNEKKPTGPRRIKNWDGETIDSRKYVDYIDENLDLMKKIITDSSSPSFNKKLKLKYKNIEFYFRNDSLIKIKINSLDDIIKYSKEFYFKNGKIYFVSFKDYEVKNINEDKDIEDFIGGICKEFYFYDEKLIGYSFINLVYSFENRRHAKFEINEVKRSYYENLILDEINELKEIIPKNK